MVIGYNHQGFSINKYNTLNTLLYTVVKACLKTHTYMANALLPLEELAGQNTKLLYMLQESAESKLNIDMSYLHGFWPAKKDFISYLLQDCQTQK
jgi:hypothetical protein